jgi:putative sigma-54 modulation protein
MRIRFRGPRVELTPVLRAHAERRLGLALGKFGELVDVVTVRLSKAGAAGHGGAPEKRCQIDVSLRPRSLSVEDSDADLVAALDRATDRASRSVARTLERERDDGSSGG